MSIDTRDSAALSTAVSPAAPATRRIPPLRRPPLTLRGGGPNADAPASASSVEAAAAAVPDLASEEAAPIGWRATLVAAVESWTGSLAFHVVVLLVLAFWLVASPPESSGPMLSVVERLPETITQRLDEQLEAAANLNMAVGGGPTSLTSTNPGDPIEVAGPPALDRQVAESLVGPAVKLADVSLHAMPTNDLTENAGINSPGDPSAGVEGYGGALDRVTQELVLMLAKSDVLALWLFDQSESMKDDQQEVRQRIGRIYQELGLTGSQSSALLTSVASFGQGYQLHTAKPTADPEAVSAAIDLVPIDESGVEMTCAAVVEMVRSHRKFATQGKRQLALILVTDESGDDGDRIEDAIAECRSANCRVYVLGREAVFGYPYAHIVWKDPQTNYTYWLPINRGPETAMPEQLQTNGLWRRYDAHPSGFGPYELVRLCRETGGVYFILPSLESNLLNGEKRIYALESMRPYLPDLSSRAEYLAERSSSELREALWQIIATLNPYQQSRVALREYYSVDPSRFALEVGEEARKAHDLLAAFDAAEKRLDQLQSARSREPLPRWQANYDLLYAQVVSYKVRVYEYLAYLDAFMRQPKTIKEPKTNRWRIVTRERTMTQQETQEYLDRSKALLQAVMAQHAGTPYAARAEWELRRGFGIDLIEHFHPPDYDEVVRPKL